ncbi:MAG: hypothetical protein COU35_04110 [Candidatus Magasanikbacteria bacterium CG10_big_fil_rev_8_21_14_0_10_47_10]|uniref:Integral membrane protein n=1 Tax=Candidatus Magasanikbacteria bacterium CG10_big_fil_rev_8_21_14_0_10_47_10 TaxID=1974652 RepID=A0A2H0TPM2_9BACT|nr:MAG: hypothetical protein COU35_04110 [Candidatus Magasanikbacteria bacterium CG10_big_fil_rev_8_21_14_0_10_47_10]
MYLAIRIAKYKTALLIAATLAFGLLLAPSMASAQPPPAPAAAANGDVFGVNPVAGSIALGKRGLQETIAGVINVALSLLGIIAVVIVLIGGFKWMTAGGSEDKVAEARKLIFSGIIGLAIIMSAWAIARFVIVNLASETGNEGGIENVQP